MKRSRGRHHRHGSTAFEHREHGPGVHRREGRRGKRFAGEELRLMVLGLLEADEPQHGYQLIRGFAERSGDAYRPSPGVLYPLLTLLQDMGLVEEAQGEGGNRRSYRLTESGRADLDANREALDALFARVAAMARTAARTDGGPVRRAIMNLRAAIHGRLGRDDADDALVFQAAAILDEAAQRIERL
ncbi:MAG: PadR family transcriptional regulator [Novosphingobium sp.]|nr:PadR family transcriptional regulator [Novosphingobium sp.]